MTKCVHPNCQLEGEFKAPKDPRDLNSFQYFCQAHIKEFNKRWNGLKGFDQEEIFSMQHGAATWNRPTWKMGVGKADGSPNFKTAEDLYSFFKQRRVNEAKITTETQEKIIPADVQEACSIFDLKEPMGGKQLKQKYLKLVKKNHPDLNPDSTNAEDKVKRINVAYRILEDFSDELI